MIFKLCIHQSENYSIHYSYVRLDLITERQDPNVSLLIFRQLRQEKTESRNWNEKLYFVATRRKKM